MLARLAELVFPARCVGCGRRGVALCPACRRDLRRVPAEVCPRCAAIRGPGGVCLGCRRLSPALNRVRAACVYEGAARNAVLILKFRAGRYLAPVMGELLREALVGRPLRADVVVPVPLAPDRRRERGFNQAFLLAEQVAGAVHGVLAEDVLVRRERAAQRTLSAAERWLNLQDAFCCPQPARIDGRRILLVDDVVTTGATLSACADDLAAAGARQVSGLAFARDL